MSKVLKVAALAGSVVLSVASFGASAALTSAIVGAIGVSSAVAGVVVGTITAGLALIGSTAFTRRQRQSLPDLDRLNLTSIAAAPRKMVLGETAMATDLRYQEPSGADQRFVDFIVHLASHKVTSVDSIYIADKLAWTAAGGVQGEFVGFMTVEVITEAGPSAYHTVNAGARWGAAQRMTGCATMKVRVDRQGTKRAASPFAAGVPPQMVIVGKGMPVYDPRRDSTVPGGSGPHRANDQSTWQWNDGATVLGTNLALQALAYLLGWRINGVVSVGLGLPTARLDLRSFALSANACDEAVALQAGGNQRRYETHYFIADNTDPRDVLAAFALNANGWWDDSTGRLAFHVGVNDLAGATVTLTDDDILDAIEWAPFPEIEAQHNVVRGLNPDPAAPALFQPTDYPEQRIASPDGIDRVLELNLSLVQEKRRAQRIARQVLQRRQYQGLARLTAGVRAWRLKVGEPMRVTSAQMGWTNRLFRVESWKANLDGSVGLELREENAAIYAWDRDESPVPVPATPVIYSPFNNPLLVTSGPDIGVEDDATRNNPTGPYDNAATYVRGDIVLRLGASYQLIVASSTGHPPPDGTRWKLLAESVTEGVARASTATITAGNTAAYNTSGGAAGPLTLNVAPGTVTLGVTVGYESTSGSYTMVGKFQQEITFASDTWTDIDDGGVEVTGDTSTVGEPGFLNFTKTVAGPGTPGQRRYRFLNRRTAGTGDAIILSGSIFEVAQG